MVSTLTAPVSMSGPRASELPSRVVEKISSPV